MYVTVLLEISHKFPPYLLYCTVLATSICFPKHPAHREDLFFFYTHGAPAVVLYLCCKAPSALAPPARPLTYTYRMFFFSLLRICK